MAVEILPLSHSFPRFSTIGNLPVSAYGKSRGVEKALRKTTPKAVAAELGVSLSLVYKWAEKPGEFAPGSKNPLDRLLQIIDLSGDNGIVEWLCRQQSGHFVKDPAVGIDRYDHVLPATQEIIGQFSDLLTRISDAADDHSVTKDEADEIRQCWDKLKSFAEGFVRACENGDFKQMSHLPGSRAVGLTQ